MTNFATAFSHLRERLTNHAGGTLTYNGQTVAYVQKGNAERIVDTADGLVVMSEIVDVTIATAELEQEPKRGDVLRIGARNYRVVSAEPWITQDLESVYRIRTQQV